MKFENITSVLITNNPDTATITLLINFKPTLLQKLFNKSNTKILVKQSIINRNNFYIAGKKHRNALKGKPLVTINKIIANFIPPSFWSKYRTSEFEFSDIDGFYVKSNKKNNTIYAVRNIAEK